MKTLVIAPNGYLGEQFTNNNHMHDMEYVIPTDYDRRGKTFDRLIAIEPVNVTAEMANVLIPCFGLSKHPHAPACMAWLAANQNRHK